MKFKNFIIPLSPDPDNAQIRSSPLTNMEQKSKSPNLNTIIKSSSEKTLLLPLNPIFCLSCLNPTISDDSGATRLIKAESVVGIGEESSLPFELRREILYISFELSDKEDNVRLIPI